MLHYTRAIQYLLDTIRIYQNYRMRKDFKVEKRYQEVEICDANAMLYLLKRREK